MRLIAETAVFAAAVLTGLRHYGVETSIPELDRYIGVLLSSVYSAFQYVVG